MEDLMARIDTPLLDSIGITFFHQLIFDIPQFAQFMRRTARFQALDEAHVAFDYHGVRVEYLPRPFSIDEVSGLRISCTKSDWQLSSVSQIFTSFFPSTDMVEHLYIYNSPNWASWQDDIENMQWQEMLHPFAAVKNLYLDEGFAQRIAPALGALQELVGEGMTEALPTLQNIFWESFQPLERIPEGIGKFVAARQLSDHPITVSHWDRFSSWIVPTDHFGESSQLSDQPIIPSDPDRYSSWTVPTGESSLRPYSSSDFNIY
jgi:hypothetical protein